MTPIERHKIVHETAFKITLAHLVPRPRPKPANDNGGVTLT